MKTTVKGKGKQGTRLKSLKENRRDITKAAKAAIKPSGKSKVTRATKIAATVAAAVVATAAGGAVGKKLLDASRTAKKRKKTSRDGASKKSTAKRA